MHAGHPYPPESMHSAMPQLQQMTDDRMSCQMSAEHPPIRRSASMTFPLPSQFSDSSMTCQTPVQQQRHLEASMSGLSQGCQQNLEMTCALCACLTCAVPAASVCLCILAETSVSQHVIGSQEDLLCANWEQCRYGMCQCRSCHRAVCGKQREPANRKC